MLRLVKILLHTHEISRHILFLSSAIAAARGFCCRLLITDLDRSFQLLHGICHNSLVDLLPHGL